MPDDLAAIHRRLLHIDQQLDYALTRIEVGVVTAMRIREVISTTVRTELL